MDDEWNRRLISALLGKRPRAEALTVSKWGRPMLCFMGADAGFSGGDVHRDRSYRVYLELQDGAITGAEIQVDGDLISPCSGYFPEALDRLDFDPVLRYCLERMDDSPAL